MTEYVKRITLGIISANAIEIPTEIETARAEIQSRMPAVAEVATYIQRLDGEDLRHTLPEISQHFLGIVLDTRRDILLYNQIFTRMQKAQKLLSKRTGRKFFGMRQTSDNGRVKGGIMVYQLEPKNDSPLPLQGSGTVYATPVTTTPATRGVKVVRG